MADTESTHAVNTTDEVQDDASESYEGEASSFIDDGSGILEVLTTQDGETITDVLAGIRDALDKHNKLMFRISNILGDIRDKK